MAHFCTGCGKELEENAVNCPNCGKAVSENTAAKEEPKVGEVPVAEQSAAGDNTHQSQQTYQHNQPRYDYHQAGVQAEENKPASTWAYFGLMFLFAIPIIGFIACIIMAFAPKNQSLKNYARARLIWAIIGFILSLILIIGIAMFGYVIMDDILYEIEEFTNNYGGFTDIYYGM